MNTAGWIFHPYNCRRIHMDPAFIGGALSEESRLRVYSVVNLVYQEETKYTLFCKIEAGNYL